MKMGFSGSWQELKGVCQTARCQFRLSPILPTSSAAMNLGKIPRIPNQEINHGYSICMLFAPPIPQSQATSKPPGKYLTDSRELKLWPKEGCENFWFICGKFSPSN